MSSSIIETKRLRLQPLFPGQRGGPTAWLPAEGAALPLHLSLGFASQAEADHFEAGFHQYQQFDAGRWAIIRKQDGCLLGWCGLKFAEGHHETTLGFRLAPAYWSHGYSAEAAKACLQFAFTQMEVERITARVSNRNKGAGKVLSTLGMTKQPIAKLAGNDEATEEVYAISKEEWLSLQ